MHYKHNSSNHILMVRPASFGFNKDTAVDNKFQNFDEIKNLDNLEEKALSEFDNYVNYLRENDLDVVVVDDTPDPYTPDALFPNNWFTTHKDGRICLYPMKPLNRRLERRTDVIEMLEMCFHVSEVIDLSKNEENDIFLEGTGSIIFDRVNKVAFACRSHRTDEVLFRDHMDNLGYEPVLFDSVDEEGTPIYHTNVMLSIASDFVVVCGESMPDPKEKEQLFEKFRSLGKEIIDVTYEQLKGFTCNVLEVTNLKGEKTLTMSTKAYHAFTDQQKEAMSKYVKLLHSSLDTIEIVCGGGSRCMMAEIYLDEQLYV
ncbi:amidinotransferase [Flammeovirga sp. MY04]|uniref:citrulline utilization hydrolase CtlX n=1 Tax=Flammeovirga sp. MY04 TaxID=1191459 RepID=UPI000825DC66|nr:arginine deiminase-related protein [Flammeovirga sp. MY04]ANQ51295.2 amidinotransferase [Flammeovirga sp. MY04]